MSTPAIESLTNGKLLQIMFSEGVRNQLSRDSRDWDMVKMMKVDDAKGRQLNYMIQTSMGPSAIQYRNANLSGVSLNFPAAQKVATQELSAEYKEIDMTIEIDYNLWNRLQKSKEVRYFDILALELQSKMDAAKRRFSADLYGDGTGVMGQLGASAAAVESGKIRFTLSSADTARGHVGFFEAGDILVLKTNAGGTSAIDTNLATEPAYWQVVSRRRSDESVLLQGLDATLASVTVTSISVQPASGDVFYRYGHR